MSMITQGSLAGQFLLSEERGQLSRGAVTLLAGVGALPSGQVLGQITASGKFKPYANGATDGSGVASAILFAPMQASASDQRVLVIARKAEVISAMLTGVDSTAVAQLLAVKISVRGSVASAGGGGAALSISGSPITTGTTGAPYAGFTVAASGGVLPYTFGGNTPASAAGLSINSATGAVSGTVGAPGTYAGIVFSATDAIGAVANLAAFTLTAAAAASNTTAGAIASNRLKFPTAEGSYPALLTSQVSRWANPAGACTNFVFRDSWTFLSGSFLITVPTGTPTNTFKKFLEYPQGTFTPVLYGGSATATMNSTTRVAVSDPVAVVVPAGAQYWEHTINMGGTVNWATAELPAQSATIGAGDARYTAGAGGVPSHQAASTATSSHIGSFLITADVAAAGVKSVYSFGDSIDWAQGDITSSGSKGASGYLARLMDVAGYSHAMFAYPGMSASDVSTLLASGSATVTALLSAINGSASHVVNQLGVNDLRLGRTQAQLTGDATSILNRFPSKVKGQCTLTPRSSTTDAYATTANQTPRTDGNWAALSAMNGAIRAGLSGVAFVIEAADAAMTARDSGIWPVPGFTPTMDGTHPTSQMAAQMASNIVLGLP